MIYIEHFTAVLALVAPGGGVATVRAGPDDIAVRQEAAVGVGVDLLGDALLKEAVLPELARHRLGHLPVLGGGGPTEVVPGQAEPRSEVRLHLVLLPAEARRVHARFGCCQLGGGTVLVGGTDEEGLMSLGPLEPGEDIRRQHGSRQGP